MKKTFLYTEVHLTVTDKKGWIYLHRYLKMNFFDKNQIFLSVKRNYRGIILMLFAAFILATAQLIWAISNLNHILLISGFILYGIGAMSMILAYRYGSLSVLHPLLSTSYILSYIYGVTILSEKISQIEIIGLTAIILGVGFIAIGDR